MGREVIGIPSGLLAAATLVILISGGWAVAGQGPSTGVGGAVQTVSDGDARALSNCDRFMAGYLSSSARKLWRGLARGDYGFEPVGIEDSLRITGRELGRSDDVVFEVVAEANGRMVGLIDRRREWKQTYLVALSSLGPIIVSQTWQPRHLRDAGQACKPISSAVVWPRVSASAVDIEPFEFWGLRISWRIPPVETMERSDRQIREILVEAMRRFAGSDEESAVEEDETQENIVDVDDSPSSEVEGEVGDREEDHVDGLMRRLEMDLERELSESDD